MGWGLLRTFIWSIEESVRVEGWEVGALALNTGWFCSQSHSDTDGKNKHFQVTRPPGVAGEGEEEGEH